MAKVSVDLLEYGSLKAWAPKLGDVILKDGLFFRWAGIIDGINGESLSIIKAGNVHLAITGDSKSSAIINIRNIIYSRFGKYMVISNGVFFI